MPSQTKTRKLMEQLASLDPNIEMLWLYGAREQRGKQTNIY